MRINELMAGVHKKISDECREVYGSRFRRNLNSIIESKAIDLECRVTLKKLEALLCQQGEKEATIENLLPFKELLSQRWNALRGTKLAYYNACKSSMTLLCLDIVERLSPIFGQHKYKLLMPTISTSNEVSLTNLDEDDANAIVNGNHTLQLHEFVLSDDDTTLINVFECLQYAKEDTQLKHTHLLEKNKMKLLSDSERDRIINHSLVSKNYYEAILQLHEVKVKGANVGAFIRRLIEKLRAGGEGGGRDGTAETAGKDASGGIQEFYYFLKIFSEDEKRKINSCFTTYNTIAMTFELCWLHLLSRAAIENKIDIPEAELSNIIELLSLNPMRSVPCVELIAQDLERILNNHPELFQLYPADKEFSKRIAAEMSESHYDEAKVNFIHFMEGGANSLLGKYSHNGKARLLKQVYGYLVGGMDDLKNLVREIPSIYRLKLFQEGLGKEKLESIIRHAADLKFILENILDVDFQEELFNIIGHPFVQSIIKSADDVKNLLSVLCKPMQVVFLRDVLGKEHLGQIVQTDEDVEKILQSLAKDVHAEIISLLGASPEKFINIMSHSAQTVRLHFNFFSSPMTDVEATEMKEDEIVDRHFDLV